ncbi:hypothetical protein FIBSPDRAFT_879305 [Athelia psychrophila]|uniref:Uncharacterized protein n=1 Tax=Athelia psychrophila TaxID=1759441 RepID=A0A167U4T2_9AGAM|nr:hypothetical protein FIBSPDRAFT_879305 [Fibularhizoctonia sp. CBS 109695]
MAEPCAASAHWDLLSFSGLMANGSCYRLHLCSASTADGSSHRLYPGLIATKYIFSTQNVKPRGAPLSAPFKQPAYVPAEVLL